MSTKNLARTVIEGGRHRYSKYQRRRSNTAERRRAHQLEHALAVKEDPDRAIFEQRPPVYRDFADKLGPAQRWLRSQVGRPWNKVRSELFTRFDTRTTAGRHILFCHLLEDVDVESKRNPERCRFQVSAAGILHYVGRRQRFFSWYRPLARLPEPEGTIVEWLASRRVIEHGARAYWLLATPAGGFRQHHELSEAEARRFRALPDWFRQRFEGAPCPTEGQA
jgi:hypothetical protein